MDGWSPAAARLVGALAAGVCALAGCGTTGPAAQGGGWNEASAVPRLSRPLPGSMAALYRLRVPATGGLRLSVTALEHSGRLSVSERFGSALSITAWDAGAPPVLLDFREGCRLEAGDVSAVLGVGRLPLPQVVRLLGGRLPAVDGDLVETAGGGRLRVEGLGWSCVVTVAADPWRVVEVASESDGEPWQVRLDRHTASLPGRVRIERDGGDEWAELELVSLEWGTVEELPDLPELPPCR